MSLAGIIRTAKALAIEWQRIHRSSRIKIMVAVFPPDSPASCWRLMVRVFSVHITPATATVVKITSLLVLGFEIGLAFLWVGRVVIEIFCIETLWITVKGIVLLHLGFCAALLVELTQLRIESRAIPDVEGCHDLAS